MKINKKECKITIKKKRTRLTRICKSPLLLPFALHTYQICIFHFQVFENNFFYIKFISDILI